MFISRRFLTNLPLTGFLAFVPLATAVPAAAQTRASVTILEYDGQACRQDVARSRINTSQAHWCVRGVARHPAGVAAVTVGGADALLRPDSTGGTQFTGFIPTTTEVRSVAITVRATSGEVTEEVYRLAPGARDPLRPELQTFALTNLRPRVLGGGGPPEPLPPPVVATAPVATAASAAAPPAAPPAPAVTTTTGSATAVAVAAAPAQDPGQFITILEPREWAVGGTRGITIPARRSLRVVGYVTHPNGVASVEVDGAPAALMVDRNGNNRFVAFVGDSSSGTREVLVQVNGRGGNPVIGRYPFNATPATSAYASKTEPWNATTGFRGKRWALVVGVSEYQDTAIRALRYADDDAQAFYDFLRSPRAGGGGFPESQIKLLLNQHATFAELRAGLRTFLAQATPDDEVIIYFAGHGAPDPRRPDDLYLLTNDTRAGEVSASGFPMRDLERAVNELQAKHIVVFTDACHSGGIFSNMRAAENRINDAFMAQLSASYGGLTIFAASEANQTSEEGEKWGGGHGVFTHFLLEGLNGAADQRTEGGDGDGIVTLVELMHWTMERVRRETGNMQVPSISNRTYDGFLPLSMVMDSAELAAAATVADPATPVVPSPGGTNAATMAQGGTGVRAPVPQALADSIALAEQAVATFPNSGQYRSRLGGLLGRAGRHDEAIAALREAARLDPQSAEYKYELGLALRDADLVAQSLEAFEAAIARDGNVARFYAGYGVALLRAGRASDAVDKLRRASRMEPGVAQHQAGLGRALKAAGRPGEATVAFQAAVQLDAASAEYRGELALALEADDRADRAISEMIEAARLAPAEPSYRRELGRLLQASNRSDEARNAYTEAVRLDSANAGSHAALAALLQAMSRPFEAVLEYRAAIRLDPQTSEYHAQLGEIFLTAEQADSAVAHLRQAVTLAPDRAAYHNALGRALRKAGLPVEALESLNEAARLDGTTAQYFYDLGTMYAETGSWSVAVVQLQQASRLAPSNDTYKNALREAQRRTRN